MESKNSIKEQFKLKPIPKAKYFNVRKKTRALLTKKNKLK
tara:strand:- start:67 stop:186 length:120 start_codon:yes stop_codon:yes gene_type:complete